MIKDNGSLALFLYARKIEFKMLICVITLDVISTQQSLVGLEVALPVAELSVFATLG